MCYEILENSFSIYIIFHKCWFHLSFVCNCVCGRCLKSSFLTYMFSHSVFSLLPSVWSQMQELDCTPSTARPRILYRIINETMREDWGRVSWLFTNPLTASRLAFTASLSTRTWIHESTRAWNLVSWLKTRASMKTRAVGDLVFKFSFFHKTWLHWVDLISSRDTVDSP